MEKYDFISFKNLAYLPAAMAVHIVLYEATDDKIPAMFFEGVIENVLPKKIGFDGLFRSNDLSIKALSGITLSENFSDLTPESFCVRL